MADSVINTFDKGINQDISFILQPDGTYRNMKNGMLISFDGNHYTVEMTKGNKILLTLNPIYTAVNNQGCTLKEALPMPIGFISFIDKLVVFSTNSETTTGYGEIGVIEFTRVGLDFVGTYVPYYNHQELNFTKLHKIEGFSFKENDNIKRVYWTDNFNEPRVFNIANPIFTTYLSTGSLVVGKKYMVLNGVILHNTFRYGPSNGTNIPTAPNYVNSNIFTAANANFTTVAGTPLVIEYYDIKLLDWQPDRLLGNIDFVEYGTGSVNCGEKIYFYRLSSTPEGVTTSWSYASNPIHVAMSTNSQAAYVASTNGYHNFAGNGSLTTLENSGRSVKVKISNIDTTFDTIEVCCAEFDQEVEIPYKISVISKETITGSSMTIEHTGATNLSTVSISDLTLFPASVLRVKTLTTNKNYNIIGNITERNEFPLDLSGVTVGALNYPMLAHEKLDSCVNNLTYNPGDLVLGVNPAGVGGIAPNTRYLVTDITGGDITYNAVTYTLGEVFVGVTASTNVTIPVGSQCRPCTTRNRYTSLLTGKRVEDAIEIKTGFWNYSDPAVASHNRGYWSNERYRLGILPYDLKGNPFYVKHIVDIDMPDISTKGGLLTSKTTATYGTQYSINATGLVISGLDLPQWVMDNCSGFSIVRVERDARIVTQGLGLQMCAPVPSYGLAYSYFIGAMAGGQCLTPLNSTNYLGYICPDWLTGTPLDSAWNKDGNYIEEAGWIRPSDYNTIRAGVTAGTYVSADLSPVITESKLFEFVAHNPATSGTGNSGADLFKTKLELMNGNPLTSLNENQVISDIGGGYGVSNKIAIDNLVVKYDWATCAGGVNPAVMNRSIAAGSKKLVILLDNMFNNWNIASSYTLANSYVEKMLLNYVKNIAPSEQYGGSSTNAIANSLYISTGHFQPITAQVKADTDTGTTFASGDYAGQKKYTFNNIEVFGGDCYTQIVDTVYGLLNTSDVVLPDLFTYAYTLYFPCESNSNFNLRRGRTGARQGASNSGSSVYPNGIVYDDGSGSIRLEDYSYNHGYSTVGDFIKYPALPVNYNFTGNFDYRMRWAGLKYPGELIDSFRVFRIPDYRDLDGQRGQINNVKSRDSKLFYWQDHSVGYTPILERQLVGGSALGDATALGVTGVIDRYDDIDTYFGNQHQHGLTETEYGFAWFDMRRRAFMVMGIGSKPEEMSMIKGLQVFFNNEFNEGNLPLFAINNGIYNTNNLSIPEIPLMGYGIVGVYDPTFKMTYLTFKYNSVTTVDFDILPFPTPRIEENKDFTLGYNHILNAFVSFTDCLPAIWHNHNDLVVSANNGKNLKAYNVDMPSTTYEIGDTVTTGNIEYICIQAVTIASYPGTLTAVTGTSPLAPSSASWVAINQTNQIYLQNFGAELCKFYGKVWNFEHEIIVNPKKDMAMTFQNAQIKSTGPNYTDIYFSTDNQTSQDVSISATNRNYRLIDKSWFSNFPLPSNGRLTDYYLKVKFVFKNYVTVPTTAKNVQKVVQWIKTMFIEKR
jgi:hypothetical protein